MKEKKKIIIYKFLEVKANVEKADIDCFDKVVTEVKKMVVRDSILKFTNTNTYKDHKGYNLFFMLLLLLFFCLYYRKKNCDGKIAY